MIGRGKPVVLLAVSVLAVLASVADAPAQREKTVISMWEKRVEVFRQFFAAKPAVLIKTPFPDAPNGFVLQYRRLENAAVTHDLQKSASLTERYAASIIVTYASSDSRRCGAFAIDDSRFFLTPESARQSRGDESCYVRQTLDGEEYRTTTKFVFSLEKKKWVFREAVTKDGAPDPLFAPLLGKTVTDWSSLEDNAVFKKLLQ